VEVLVVPGRGGQWQSKNLRKLVVSVSEESRKRGDTVGEPSTGLFQRPKVILCGSRSKPHEWHDHAQSWVRQQYPRVFWTALAKEPM